jgi:hypothetical protein
MTRKTKLPLLTEDELDEILAVAAKAHNRVASATPEALEQAKEQYLASIEAIRALPADERKAVMSRHRRASLTP